MFFRRTVSEASGNNALTSDFKRYAARFARGRAKKYFSPSFLTSESVNWQMKDARYSMPDCKFATLFRSAEVQKSYSV